MVRRCVWSRNIKNGCSISRLRVNILVSWDVTQCGLVDKTNVSEKITCSLQLLKHTLVSTNKLHYIISPNYTTPYHQITLHHITKLHYIISPNYTTSYHQITLHHITKLHYIILPNYTSYHQITLHHITKLHYIISPNYTTSYHQITLHHITKEYNRDLHYFCFVSLTASVALRFVSKFRKFCSGLSLKL